MKTLIVGFDAFDPATFESLYEQGKLPNLSRYVEADRYARFSVTDPPQSEVSWTSIATGLNPGAHGIFDFVHRQPGDYRPFVSLLPTKRGLTGTHFAPPSRARTLFDQAVRLGYEATALWWPATFPAERGSPVRTIPGLGTPDMHGKLGVGTLFSQDRAQEGRLDKTGFGLLMALGEGRFRGRILGPAQERRGRSVQASVDLELELLEGGRARLALGGDQVEIREGQWSPILEVQFKMGWFVTIRTLTRVILTQTEPSVRLYFLPLQLHPLHSLWPYASPPRFAKETWKACGPFLTVGWPQDTTGLEEGCIGDEQFLTLCQSILESRSRALLHHLGQFREGVLAIVFDSLDRVQHMFWRDRPDVIEDWYQKLDGLIGTIELAYGLDETAQLLIVSDHGFTTFDHKVHLNRWLLDRGFLAGRSANNGAGDFKDIDWSKTRAYALGLNSIYVNQIGREGQGTVPAERTERLLNEIAGGLKAWGQSEGKPVVGRILTSQEAFEGPLARYGPDLVVGYSPGFRASAQTGLGGWGDHPVVPNEDHWGADHCVDAQAVPGVLFARHGLANRPSPSYSDIPWLAIGAEPDDSVTLPPPSLGNDDMQVVEDRLRSLGYL